MKRKQRGLAMFLALVLLSAVWTGCAGKKNATSTPAASEANPSEVQSEGTANRMEAARTPEHQQALDALDALLADSTVLSESAAWKGFSFKPSTEEGAGDVFATIDALHNEGKMDQKTRSLARVLAVLDPESLGDTYGAQVNPHQLLGVSREAQWLVNHLDALTKGERALVEQLLHVGDPVSTSAHAGFSPFFLTANASVTDWTSVEIATQVTLHTNMEGDQEIFEDLVTQVVLLSAMMMESTVGQPIRESVEIYLTRLLPVAESLSYHTTGIDEDGNPVEVTRILLNPSIPTNRMSGALLHELVHAVQYEMGYDRTDLNKEWTMEATAVWGVAMMAPNLGYHQAYNGKWYEVLPGPADAMDETTKMSWYQLFLHAGEVLGHSEYARRLMEIHAGEDDLNEALDAAFGGASGTADLFESVALAHALLPDTAVESSATGRIAQAFPIAASDDISQTAYIAQYNNIWQPVPMKGIGFRPVHITVDHMAATHLEVMINMEDPAEVREGIAVLSYGDAGWMTEYRRADEKASVTIDLEAAHVSEVLLVAYAYDVIGQPSKSINLSFNVMREGNGTLSCQVTRKSMEMDDAPQVDQHFDMQVAEVVKLYQPVTKGDARDYVQLVLGDVYFVDRCEVDFNGSEMTDMENGDHMEIYWSGNYVYQHGQAPEGSFDNNPFPGLDALTDDSSDALLDPPSEVPADAQLESPADVLPDVPPEDMLKGPTEDLELPDFPFPDLPTLPEVNHSPSETQVAVTPSRWSLFPVAATFQPRLLQVFLMPLLGISLPGLPSLPSLPAMPSMPDLPSDLLPPGLKDELDAELSAAMREWEQAQEEMKKLQLDGLFAPSTQLNRAKIDLNNKLLHFYPAFPPDLTTKEWVKEDRTFTTTDPEGHPEIIRSEEQTVLPSGSLFPLWFENPDYDEATAQDVAMSLPKTPEDMLDAVHSSKDAMDQVALLNGLLDRENLVPGLDGKTRQIELDTRRKDLNGFMTQTLSMEGGRLMGTLTSSYVDGGDEVTVTLTMDYQFE